MGIERHCVRTTIPQYTNGGKSADHERNLAHRWLGPISVPARKVVANSCGFMRRTIGANVCGFWISTIGGQLQIHTVSFIPIGLHGGSTWAHGFKNIFSLTCQVHLTKQRLFNFFLTLMASTSGIVRKAIYEPYREIVL